MSRDRQRCRKEEEEGEEGGGGGGGWGWGGGGGGVRWSGEECRGRPQRRAHQEQRRARPRFLLLPSRRSWPAEQSGHLSFLCRFCSIVLLPLCVSALSLLPATQPAAAAAAATTTADVTFFSGNRVQTWRGITLRTCIMQKKKRSPRNNLD